MRENTVLKKMRSGQASFGLILTVGAPILAEEAAQVGLDWVALDTQHGYWGDQALMNAIQVVSHTLTLPFARIGGNDPFLIGRHLDAGCLGVIVPLVNSEEEARQAVEAARFPPEGKRSGGGSRLRQYSQSYFTEANPEIFLAVMLETAQAVEHADRILSVPGVDCGFIGVGDLALDLGTFGRESQRHEEAIQTILKAGQRHGVPIGMPCASLQAARQRAAQGFQFLSTGSDTEFFWRGLSELEQGLAET